MSSTTTLGSVQEILLKSITYTGAELWASARKRATLMIASIGIVSLRVGSHQCLALLIP